ncbi:DUF3024 domain-containing protein, partial [Pseudomonas nitroreducens]
VEVRPPWDGVGEHTRFPIARLRYTKSTGQWAIYWRDRNLRFHRYDSIEASPHVDDLLAEIEADPTGIFWG